MLSQLPTLFYYLEPMWVVYIYKFFFYYHHEYFCNRDDEFGDEIGWIFSHFIRSQIAFKNK